MQKISKLISLPVLSEKNGMWLGRINDVFFDAKSLNIVGYIVATGSVLPISRFLRTERIRRIDKGCVWVADKSVFLPQGEIKKYKNFKSFQRDTEGIDIIENGGKIGKISDLLYKMEVGEITHFEVSNGFSEDVLNGRKKINVNKEIIFGNNNVEITDKGV